MFIKLNVRLVSIFAYSFHKWIGTGCCSRFFKFHFFYPDFGLGKICFYRYVPTLMLMCTRFITWLLTNFAYRFVTLVTTSCRNRFFENVFFSILILILDFLKMAFIAMSALKWLCASGLSLDKLVLMAMYKYLWTQTQTRFLGRSPNSGGWGGEVGAPPLQKYITVSFYEKNNYYIVSGHIFNTLGILLNNPIGIIIYCFAWLLKVTIAPSTLL